MKAFIIRHKALFLLIALYFVLRLINLTLLPIFNDESIYLDWGWRELHFPGYLFYSLYDAKQPFLMWIFSLSQSIFSDPLFAGRLVSILFGLTTLIGIYKIAQQHFSKTIAVLSCLLYIGVPIFSFYDRQALMETAVGAAGIWAIYMLLKYLHRPQQKYSLFLGFFFALGFWIKSSAIVIILATLFVIFVHFLKSKEKKDIALFGIYSILIFLVCMIPLFLQPMYWATLSTNSRYSLTASQLLSFPFSIWLTTLWDNTQILFFFLTPLVSVFSIAGIVLAWKKKNSPAFSMALWVIAALLLQNLFVKNTSQRYLVSFLPILCIFAAVAGEYVSQRAKQLKYPLIILVLGIPFALTLLQLFSPLSYILDLHRLTPMSQGEYVTGYTSGIGVEDTMNYLTQKANGQPLLVAIAENTGNPESALLSYFAKSPNIKIFYFDSRMFGNSLDNFDCLKGPVPIYFISRDNYTAGVTKFFTLEKKIENPYSPYYIGIYHANTNCKGKILQLQ